MYFAFVGCVLTAGFIVGSRRCGLELKSSVCPSLETCTEVVVVVPYLCDVDCCVACQERRRAGSCLAAVCRGYRTLRAVPRNSALTTSASAFLEVDCCSVKAVSLARIRAVVTFWCVFCLSVCLVLSVYDGCVPWMCSFHK